jgi:prepilin-type N-terminal cleavage/methylation domain-containing protein
MLKKPMVATAKRGFTLIEVLVVMVIIGLVGVGVMVVYVSGAGLAVRSTNKATAEAELSRALSKMSEDIRAARQVSSAGTARIELALPQVDSDTDRLILPQRTGGYAAYYLSDTSGAAGRTGNYLWRAVKGTAQSDQWFPQRLVAEKINQLSFAYSADGTQVTVTAQATVGKGRRQAVNKQSSLVKLRNKLV